MSTEVIIFSAFLVISVLAHIVAEKAEEHKRRCGGPCWFPRKYAHAAAIVTALTLSHPAVWIAIREYTVHLVIYSGRILP